MPKKTKKDKLRIDQKRASYASPPTVFYQLTNLPEAAKPTTSPPPSGELLIIKRDLIKTTLLAAAAVGVEIGLYWVLGRR